MTEVPVIELHGLSGEQKKALILADNKLALNAGWDMDLLALELGELQSSGFDLSLTGFSDQELAELLSFGTPGLTDSDDIPPLPETPVSRPGDLWLLGSHGLLCGDSTRREDAEGGSGRNPPAPARVRSTLRRGLPAVMAGQCRRERQQG